MNWRFISFIILGYLTTILSIVFLTPSVAVGETGMEKASVPDPSVPTTSGIVGSASGASTFALLYFLVVRKQNETSKEDREQTKEMLAGIKKEQELLRDMIFNYRLDHAKVHEAMPKLEQHVANVSLDISRLASEVLLVKHSSQEIPDIKARLRDAEKHIIELVTRDRDEER